MIFKAYLIYDPINKKYRTDVGITTYHDFNHPLFWVNDPCDAWSCSNLNRIKKNLTRMIRDLETTVLDQTNIRYHSEAVLKYQQRLPSSYHPSHTQEAIVFNKKRVDEETRLYNHFSKRTNLPNYGLQIVEITVDFVDVDKQVTAAAITTVKIPDKRR